MRSKAANVAYCYLRSAGASSDAPEIRPSGGAPFAEVRDTSLMTGDKAANRFRGGSDDEDTFGFDGAGNDLLKGNRGINRYAGSAGADSAGRTGLRGILLFDVRFKGRAGSVVRTRARIAFRHKVVAGCY